MSENSSPIFAESASTIQETQALIGRLFAVAEPGLGRNDR